MDIEASDFRQMTADIVAAYVGSRNHVSTSELPALISNVHAALSALGTPVTEPVKAEPAVPLRKAVQPDAITCVFDGKQFKSLKRHLANEHEMTPAEYRAHWGLPVGQRHGRTELRQRAFGFRPGDWIRPKAHWRDFRRRHLGRGGTQLAVADHAGLRASDL